MSHSVDAPPMLDARGTPLAPGQLVAYAVAGYHSNGRLQVGTVVCVRRVLRGIGRHPERTDRIDINRADGGIVTIHDPKRIVILSQESEPDAWLRRQLATVTR